MGNYILLQATFGLGVGEIFLPTTDPNLYQSASTPDILIPLGTITALPEHFLGVVEFTYEDKLAGIEAAQVDEVTWTPAVGDFFSTYNNELDLWKILDDPDTDFTIVKITGNLLGLESNPANVAQSGFTDGRFQVFTPIEEESGSSSL